MPAPAKFTTQIIVTETKATFEGTNRQGGKYTLYQVIATKPDGTAINDYALRSFMDLPKRRVITVECDLYTSEQYGPSYTLTLKDNKAEPQQQRQQQAPPPQNSGMQQAMRQLHERVKRIEDFLAGRGEFAGSASTPEVEPRQDDGPREGPPPADLPPSMPAF